MVIICVNGEGQYLPPTISGYYNRKDRIRSVSKIISKVKISNPKLSNYIFFQRH